MISYSMKHNYVNHWVSPYLSSTVAGLAPEEFSLSHCSSREVASATASRAGIVRFDACQQMTWIYFEIKWMNFLTDFELEERID